MKKNTTKRLRMLAACTLLMAMLLGLSACGQAKPTLVVYNWEDYIGEETIAKFEQEFNCKVDYVRFSTNEDMYTKIKAGGASYDVAFPSDYMIERMKNEGMLETINTAGMENFSGVRADLLDLDFDKGNEVSVPYMWGTVGILYNTTKVSEPITSWKSMWDPQYSGDIIMMDSMRDSIGITLKMLGKSLNTRDQADLEAAKQTLIDQTPIVKAYVVDQAKDMMARNEGTLALVWSGDAAVAIDNNEDLAYVVPEEGSNIWFDGMVIPKGAKNKDLAEKFIDFMCRPDIAFDNADYIGYSSPITAAIDQMDDEIKNDPAYYPDLTQSPTLEVFHDLADFTSVYEELWTQIKIS